MTLSKDVHFFISYTRADKEWAFQLAHLLTAASYQVLIDERDFRGGENFVLEISDAIDWCDWTVALLSPDYLDSPYCKLEWSSALDLGKLLPVRIREANLPAVLRPHIYVDLVGQDAQRGEHLFLDRVRELAAGADRPLPIPHEVADRVVPRGYRLHNIDFAMESDFTGRKAVLEDIRARFDSGSVVQVIHGMPGVGKTRLLQQYIERYRDTYRLIWWVRSDNLVTLESDYSLLADELGIPEAADNTQRHKVDALRRWLERNGNWLVVFDNAPGRSFSEKDGLKDIRSYIPRDISVGHVLITSRDPTSWSGLAYEISLGLWSEGEAAKFIRTRLDSVDDPHVGQLAKELGFLPLAVVQAVGWIHKSSSSIADYLEIFNTERFKQWEDEHAPSDYPQTVAKTFDISRRSISEEAKCLLSLCAFLAPQAIPKLLLKENATALYHPLEDVVISNRKLGNCISELRGLGLVSATTTSISLHPLLQLVVQDADFARKEFIWALSAAFLMRRAFVFKQFLESQSWREGAAILPHVLSAIGHLERMAQRLDDVRSGFGSPEELLSSLRQGEINGSSRSETLMSEFENHMKNLKHLYGISDPLLMIPRWAIGLMSGVATYLSMVGEKEKAQNLLERASILERQSFPLPKKRSMFRRWLGMLSGRGRDWQTVRVGSLNSDMASAYALQGNWVEARRHYEDAAKAEEAAAAPDPINLATIYANWAYMELRAGKQHEAVKLGKQAQRYLRKERDTTDLDLGRIYVTLAKVAQASGQTDNVHRFADIALRILKSQRNPDRKEHFICIELTEIYVDLKEYTRARELVRWAIDRYGYDNEAGNEILWKLFHLQVDIDIALGDLVRARHLAKKRIEALLGHPADHQEVPWRQKALAAAHATMAQVERADGRIAESIKQLRQAANLDDGFRQLLTEVESELDELCSESARLRKLLKDLSFEGKHVLSYIELIVTEYSLGRTTEAMQSLRDFASNIRGLLLSTLNNRLLRAMHILNENETDDSTEYTVRQNPYGDALQRVLKMTEQVKRIAEDLLERDGSDLMWVFLWLGVTEKANNNWPQAETYCRQALLLWESRTRKIPRKGSEKKREELLFRVELVELSNKPGTRITARERVDFKIKALPHMMVEGLVDYGELMDG